MRPDHPRWLALQLDPVESPSTTKFTSPGPPAFRQTSGAIRTRYSLVEPYCP